MEAPGTAPGSNRFIALAVYHHSLPSCEGEQLRYSAYGSDLKEKLLVAYNVPIHVANIFCLMLKVVS